MSLWINMRELRRSKGLLQREAAEKLGISRVYLSAIENNQRGISINVMEAIIREFNVKYEDFKPVHASWTQARK